MKTMKFVFPDKHQIQTRLIPSTLCAVAARVNSFSSVRSKIPACSTGPTIVPIMHCYEALSSILSSYDALSVRVRSLSSIYSYFHKSENAPSSLRHSIDAHFSSAYRQVRACARSHQEGRERTAKHIKGQHQREQQTREHSYGGRESYQTIGFCSCSFATTIFMQEYESREDLCT